MLLLIELSKQQKTDEKDSIVADLFGSRISSIKGAVEKLEITEKEFLMKKIENHSEFYKKIVDENPEKPSYRIEVAKFRVNTLYPQLLKLLGNDTQ